MCEPFEKIFIECMKSKGPIREDKCKIEFEIWDTCYKNAYLKEFIKTEKNPLLFTEDSMK